MGRFAKQQVAQPGQDMQMLMTVEVRRFDARPAQSPQLGGELGTNMPRVNRSCEPAAGQSAFAPHLTPGIDQ